MAGETRGELAEAIAKVALEKALHVLGRKESVFWQESPDGAVIKPDFTIGMDPASPLQLVLVNASESAKESDKKYWRNLGEIFDAKARLPSQPAVLNLVFRSEIKPELIRLTEALCDATCLVDRHAVFGTATASWLEQNHAGAPSDREQKADLVVECTTKRSGHYDKQFADAVTHLAQHLSQLLFSTKTSLQPLWDLCSSDFAGRQGVEVRKAKVTMLRRGLARWLVFDGTVRERVFASHLGSGVVKLKEAPPYCVPLGMLRKRIGGYQIPAIDAKASNMAGTTSRDLRLAAQFYGDAVGGDAKKATKALNAALGDVPPEMSRAAEQLRSLSGQVEVWHEIALSEWENLRTPDGCYELLTECSADPTMGGRVSTEGESRVWLYDHLVAILRSYHATNNDFGYSRMMATFKEAHSQGALEAFLDRVVSPLDDSRRRRSEGWIARVLPTARRPGERGFLEWLKGEADIADASIACFAYAIATLLVGVGDPRRLDLQDLASRHTYSLWNKLLTHRDFEPLPSLIETACGSKVDRVSAPSVMGEIAGTTVQDAGAMPAFSFKDGLVFWQSAVM